MEDIAGFVIGVVPAWENCVQVFEIIDLENRYFMDYEVLCDKLEVERIQPLVWGEAVGLSEAELSNPIPDVWLVTERMFVLSFFAFWFASSASSNTWNGCRTMVYVPYSLL